MEQDGEKDIESEPECHVAERYDQEQECGQAQADAPKEDVMVTMQSSGSLTPPWKRSYAARDKWLRQPQENAAYVGEGMQEI